MSLVRIYADFNGLVRGPSNQERTAVVLDTFGSLRDLSNAGVRLKIGLPLIAFDQSDDNQDLEGHGTAQYDTKHKRWVVEFDELGVRYVPARGQRSQDTLLCINCREPVPGITSAIMGKPETLCSLCGTNVFSPFAAPEPEI